MHIPHVIQADTSPEQQWALANDNWKNTVQDISDLGAKFADNQAYFVVPSSSFPAKGLFRFTLNIADARPEYRAGKLPFGPRVSTWVDVDNDEAHRLEYQGNSLGNGNLIMVSQRVAERTAQITPNDIGTTVIEFYNFDTVAHTLYVRVDYWYLQSPRQGNFN